MKNKWIRVFLREQAGDGADGGGGDGGPNDGADGSDGGDGGGDGGANPWYVDAGFSEDVVNTDGMSDYLSRFKSAEEAVKSGYEARKKLGNATEGMVKVPGEDASEEEKAAFREAVGVPESPDKYSWKPPEGMEVDQEIFQDRLGKLHEAGLSDAQVSQAMDLYAEEITRMNEDFQNHQAEIAKETEDSLRKEWGEKYDDNIKEARAVAEKYGVIEAMKETGMINQLGVIKMLHEVSRSTREDGIDSGGGNMSASDELASLKENPAWTDKTHPEHRKLVERAVELRKRL